jgi:hypothetical protein
MENYFWQKFNQNNSHATNFSTSCSVDSNNKKFPPHKIQPSRLGVVSYKPHFSGQTFTCAINSGNQSLTRLDNTDTYSTVTYFVQAVDLEQLQQREEEVLKMILDSPMMKMKHFYHHSSSSSSQNHLQQQPQQQVFDQLSPITADGVEFQDGLVAWN